jgi:hypothetical protein
MVAAPEFAAKDIIEIAVGAVTLAVSIPLEHKTLVCPEVVVLACIVICLELALVFLIYIFIDFPSVRLEIVRVLPAVKLAIQLDIAQLGVILRLVVPVVKLQVLKITLPLVISAKDEVVEFKEYEELIAYDAVKLFITPVSPVIEPVMLSDPVIERDPV